MHCPVFDDGLVRAVDVFSAAVFAAARRCSSVMNPMQTFPGSVDNRGLLDDRDAVSGVHRVVLVAVEDDGGVEADAVRFAGVAVDRLPRPEGAGPPCIAANAEGMS